ncbi:class IIb bacteriocin, lactobin A/cerein 7B family [Streptococcus suis]|nr:class IIb bacteriocin, lactobin A/cerein 7B family [Streptococcus suis]
MDNMNTNFVALSDQELVNIEGGLDPVSVALIVKAVGWGAGALAASGFIAGVAKAFN